MNGWIGVDLDGTLAHYEKWEGAHMVGKPVEPMLDRVRAWLEEGLEVRIFTARIHPIDQCVHPGEMLRFIPEDDRGREAVAALRAVQEWCVSYLGRELPVTNVKDYGMVELWDDRCIPVERNTGRRLDPEPQGALFVELPKERK